jgi:hypothetical protein
VALSSALVPRKDKMMKRIFSAVLVVLMELAVELCVATPLSGVIRSQNGQPIPRMKVLTFAPLVRQTKFPDANMSTQRYEVMCDDKGFFRLPDHGRVVYFTHAEQQQGPQMWLVRSF